MDHERVAGVGSLGELPTSGCGPVTIFGKGCRCHTRLPPGKGKGDLQVGERQLERENEGSCCPVSVRFLLFFSLSLIFCCCCGVSISRLILSWPLGASMRGPQPVHVVHLPWRKAAFLGRTTLAFRFLGVLVCAAFWFYFASSFTLSSCFGEVSAFRRFVGRLVVRRGGHLFPLFCRRILRLPRRAALGAGVCRRCLQPQAFRISAFVSFRLLKGFEARRFLYSLNLNLIT